MSEDPQQSQHIAPNKHRELQVTRDGGRKLFDDERKAVFLEWFAATCNVKMSAERAGVRYQTVFKHRMKDREFAEAWDEALEQGYARIRAKLIETRGTPIEVDGDLDAPERSSDARRDAGGDRPAPAHGRGARKRLGTGAQAGAVAPDRHQC